ncbi:MAG: ATP-binding protein [Desulfovermiculus sp.]|nr:ATP-binding protein [Desulfovermiculus sp.]
MNRTTCKSNGRTMNIAIIGGTEFTADVLQTTAADYFEHTSLAAKMLAVADPDPESPGMIMARRLGLLTVQDYTELFDPYYGIELIIILDPKQDLFYEVLSSRPQNVRIMSYHAFHLFWESITNEAKKLRERTQEIKAILDGIQDFILVITPDMTISEVNTAFLDQMGFTRSDVIGHKCYEVFQRINRQCQCTESGEVICPLQEVIQSKEMRQRIFPRVNREGKVVYIEVTIYPIWEQDGSISKFIEISRDVTKREKEDEEINRRLEQLVEERTRELKKRQEDLLHQNKMASLGKLSASVVHEINNPISGILNLTLLMKRITGSGSLTEQDLKDFTRYLGLMETETRRISRITSNLLSFSRETKLERSAFNLNSLLEDLLFLNSNLLKISGVRVKKDFDPLLPDIIGDGEQLKQVFMNLISNAAEAMEGTRGGTLHVTTSHDRNKITIVVEDTGPGIPESTIPRLFDPFFSTKAKGKGVGLGLSVAYGIIQQHCGSMYVTSNPGQGTSMRVCLPLKQPKDKYD